jgi:hypothetical protein
MSTTEKQILATLDVAAVPTEVVVLTAAKTLIANVGTDQSQVAVKWPGALQVFLGTLQLQLPALAQSEFGTLPALADSFLDGLIAKAQALKPA